MLRHCRCACVRRAVDVYGLARDLYLVGQAAVKLARVLSFGRT